MKARHCESKRLWIRVCEAMDRLWGRALPRRRWKRYQREVTRRMAEYHAIRGMDRFRTPRSRSPFKKGRAK